MSQPLALDPRSKSQSRTRSRTEPAWARAIIIWCAITGLVGADTPSPEPATGNPVARSGPSESAPEPIPTGGGTEGANDAPRDAGEPMLEVRPAIDPLTDDLLNAIEEAGQSIRTMQATVIYDRRFLLQGDQHIRTGSLHYKSEAPSSDEHAAPPDADTPSAPSARRFSIGFDQLFVDNVMRTESQRFVFDGRWLVERDDAAQRYIAREVAPPGATFDPLRLGEGPMPIPLGQRKRDILARYDARAMPGGAEWIDDDEAARGYRAAVDAARQIVLTPRAEFAESDDFREIRLWYKLNKDEQEPPRMHLVPILSRTVARDGDVAYVRLLAFRINDDSPAAIERLESALRMSPPTEPGWEIQRIEGRWNEQDLRPAG